MYNYNILFCLVKNTDTIKFFIKVKLQKNKFFKHYHNQNF